MMSLVHPTNILRRVNTNSSSVFLKKIEECVLLNPFCEPSLSLDLNPEKDTTRKSSYQPVSVEKVLSTVLMNKIQQHIERVNDHDQVGFIPKRQCWFYNSVNVNYHINKMEDMIR